MKICNKPEDNIEEPLLREHLKPGDVFRFSWEKTNDRLLMVIFTGGELKVTGACGEVEYKQVELETGRVTSGGIQMGVELVEGCFSVGCDDN